MRIPFTRSLQFLYGLILAPRSNTEDDRRQEFILNCILAGSIILLVWSDIYILIAQIEYGHSGTSFGLFSIIVCIFVLLLILSRKGFFILASHAMIWIYFIAITYAAYLWGPSLPAALLSYALLIVISSILINTSFGVALTFIIAIIIGILGYAESQHIRLPDSNWKLMPFVMGDAVQYSVILAVIALVSWLGNREMEKSLKRARRSERILTKERNMLEIRVEERTHELKKAQAEKVGQLYRFAEFGRLSGGLFHDLMTPLSSVYLNLSRVTDSGDPQLPAIKTHLEKAVAASRRMESFISNIRKQIQTQETKAAFSPGEEIQSVIDLLRYKALRQKVEIRQDIAGIGLIFGNAMKFNQIVMNLVSNAIDSYEEVAYIENERSVLVALSSDTASLILTVSDTGCGIPASLLPHVFEQFFTTKPQHKGSGIGLSSTKTIVEKDFLGTISIASENGKGSKFTIRIPSSNESAGIIPQNDT